jgi:hypothetical protein
MAGFEVTPEGEALPLLASHLQVWLPALAEESWNLSICAYDSLPDTAEVVCSFADAHPSILETRKARLVAAGKLSRMAVLPRWSRVLAT